MAYAILRFEKRKGGPASSLEKHHERMKENYESNPDIDTNKSRENFHLIKPTKKYYAEIQSRIEQAKKENPKIKIRKDSIKFIDTIITASPEFMEELTEKEIRNYFEHALEFIKMEVNEKNIFSAVVHMDEKNPHMHLCFVPITNDGRLSAKDILGNRSRLVEWQDKFHDHMSMKFISLERGQSASDTKRKHIPTWLFKQSERLSNQMQAMQNEIDNINNFNAQKKKELIREMFEKWYPQVNAFENMIKPYARQIENLSHSKMYAEHQRDLEQIAKNQANSKVRDLSSELIMYQNFVESIDEDLRDELLNEFNNNENKQEMEMEI